MAITVVGSAQGAGIGPMATSATTSNINTTGATLFIVFTNALVSTTNAVTDSAGNTYTEILSYTAGSPFTGVYVTQTRTPITSSSFTVTYTTTGGTMPKPSVFLLALSGTNYLGIDLSSLTATSSTSPTATFTPNFNNELIIPYISSSGGMTPSASTSALTLTSQQSLAQGPMNAGFQFYTGTEATAISTTINYTAKPGEAVYGYLTYRPTFAYTDNPVDSISLVSIVTKQASPKAIAEVLTLSDITLLFMCYKMLIDVFNILDSVTRYIVHGLTDTFTIVELLVKLISRTLIDSFIILDDGIIKNSNPVISSVFTVADSIIKLSSYHLASIYTILDSNTKSTGKSIMDAAMLLDYLNGDQTNALLTESIGLFDSITKSTSHYINDTVNTLEMTLKSISSSGLIDTFSFIDKLSENFAETFIDIVSLIDTRADSILFNLHDLFNITDLVNHSDALNSFIETIGVLDSYYLNLNKVFIDLYSLMESTVNSINRTLPDSFTLFESVTSLDMSSLLEDILIFEDFFHNDQVFFFDILLLTEDLSTSTGLYFNDVSVLLDTITKNTAKYLRELVTLVDLTITISELFHYTLYLFDLIMSQTLLQTIVVEFGTSAENSILYSEAALNYIFYGEASSLTPQGAGGGINLEAFYATLNDSFQHSIVTGPYMDLINLIDILSKDPNPLLAVDVLAIIDPTLKKQVNHILLDMVVQVEYLLRFISYHLFSPLYLIEQVHIVTCKYLQESLNTIDFILKTSNRFLTDNDAVLLSDRLAKTAIRSIYDVYTLFEGYTVGDPGFMLMLNKSVIDNLSLLNSRVHNILSNRHDTISVLSTVQKYTSIYRFDLLSIIDITGEGITRAFNALDSFNILDNLIKTPNKIFIDIVSLIDSFSFTGVFHRLLYVFDVIAPEPLLEALLITPLATATYQYSFSYYAVLYNYVMFGLAASTTSPIFPFAPCFGVLEDFNIGAYRFFIEENEALILVDTLYNNATKVCNDAFSYILDYFDYDAGFSKILADYPFVIEWGVKSLNRTLNVTSFVYDRMNKMTATSPVVDTLSLIDVSTKTTNKGVFDSYSIYDVFIKSLCKFTYDLVSVFDITGDTVSYLLSVLDELGLIDIIYKGMLDILSDMTNLADTLANNITHNTVLTDIVPIAYEVVNYNINRVVCLFTSIIPVEYVVILKSLNLSLFDPMPVFELFGDYIQHFSSFIETSLVIHDISYHAVCKHLHDMTGLADFGTKMQKVLHLCLYEALTLNELIPKARTFLEILLLTDTLTILKNISLVILSHLGFAEMLSTQVTYQEFDLPTNDSVSVSDTLGFSLNKNLVYEFIPVSDKTNRMVNPVYLSERIRFYEVMSQN